MKYLLFNFYTIVFHKMILFHKIINVII